MTGFLFFLLLVLVFLAGPGPDLYRVSVCLSRGCRESSLGDLTSCQRCGKVR